MPHRLRPRLDALEVTSVARAGDASPVNVSFETLMAISNAIRADEVLRFDYASRDEQEPEHPPAPPRRAEPIHLAASNGRWYLLGWDLDREDWRLYRVDRMRLRTPNGPQFSPRAVPGGDAAEFISARFKGAEVNAWPCRGTVILDLPARQVLPFAGDGTVTPIDDDRCALEAGSWSWGSLAASFARFEVAMEVVGPGELVAAFDALAERCRAAAVRSVPERRRLITLQADADTPVD